MAPGEVPPLCRAVIEEAVRTAVEQALRAARTITREERRSACRRVERRLYGLPHLLARVKRDRERLKALEAAGDPACEGARLSARARLCADEAEARDLTEALRPLRGDYYYPALSRRYFHNENDQCISERLHCDITTVRRNRMRLLEEMAVTLGVGGGPGEAL